MHLHHRLAALSALLCALLLPVRADATVTIAPSPSYTGNYTVAWTDASGGGSIFRAYLAQSLNGGAWTKSTVTGTTQKAFTAMAVGNYAYKIQVYAYEAELKKEFFEYETPAVTVQVWKSIPAAPGAIAGPTSSESGAYTLSWAAPAGVITKYEVLENGAPVASPTTPSLSLSGKPSGSYPYKVRACNGLGCGPYTPVFTVSVSVNLTTSVADAALVPDAPLAQGWVGRLPGKAGTDGGAASYRIDVEVPPGRGGMQPSVALAYGSRGGNGIAGVGWSLSAGGTIYRCPRTYKQDGGNAPVKLTDQDRLCMDGQRLVAVNGSVYGAQGSEYRTEIEAFARVTLNAGSMASATSYFKVEHKSGRVSIYNAEPQEVVTGKPPSTWNLAAEYDQQDNCIAYGYSRLAGRDAASQWELVSIQYTGIWSATSRVCTVSAPARSVIFTHADRPDRRVTYAAGVGKLQAKRLTAISTALGGQALRRYELDYTSTTPALPDRSLATSRSLLRAVRLCAGASCGTARLPDTLFEYREALGNLGAPVKRSMTKVPCDGPCDLGEDDPGLGIYWSVNQTGDLDGDGRLDQFIERKLLGKPRERFFSTDLGATLQPFTANFADDGHLATDAATVQATADYTGDGRSDYVGTNADPARQYMGQTVPVGALGFASKTAAGEWSTAFARDEYGSFLVLPTGTWDLAGSLQDFDGDGLPDLSRKQGTGRVVRRQIGVVGELIFESTPSIVFLADPVDYYDTFTGEPIPRSFRIAGAAKDYNGDGRMDVFHDATHVDLPALMDFYNGPGSSPAFSQYTLASLGGPARLYSPYVSIRWMDVNADGLPDIFQLGTATTPGILWINRGGTPRSDMFKQVEVRGGYDIPSLRRGDVTLADYDADGSEELLVPTTRGDLQYCSWDGAEPETWYCGDQHDLGGATYGLDRSVFHWDALRFGQVPKNV